MTGGRSGGDPAALTAARHLKEFGFTGWHLIRSGDYDPAVDTLAGPDNQVERQVVEAVEFLIGDLPASENRAVFLVAGKPRPKVGDGLVALTRHWLIDKVDAMDPSGDEQIYVLLRVRSSPQQIGIGLFRAAHPVEQRPAIPRQTVAAPGNVVIGPDQHQIGAVDRARRRIVDRP